MINNGLKTAFGADYGTNGSVVPMTVMKTIGMDSDTWQWINRKINFAPDGDIQREVALVNGQSASLDLGKVLNISDNLNQVNMRPRKKLIDLGVIPAWNQKLTKQDLAIDPEVSIEQRFMIAVNDQYTDGMFIALRDACETSVIATMQFLTQNGLPSQFSRTVEIQGVNETIDLTNEDAFRTALHRLSRVHNNNYTVSMRRGFAHYIKFTAGIDFANIFLQQLASQFQLDVYRFDPVTETGSWTLGAETIESVVLDDVNRLELETVVDLREETGVDLEYTFVLRATYLNPNRVLPTADNDLPFNGYVARTIHFVNRFAPSLFPPVFKATEPAKASVTPQDVSTYTYMAQGDEKIVVPMWACPFIEDHGPNQKGGHDFVKTEAPIPFKGAIGAPSNTFPAGVTTYQLDCLTKFTSQELINMFFSDSQGQAPSGFDATGFFVDVPLDIYPMAFENYFDNESQQYYYTENSKKVWVFARVYAPAYLTVTNGKNVMFEYIRRIISNRIVGAPKRLFVHHEEVDALVNKSNNRAFVSTYEAASIGSTQVGFLDKLYDVSGLTDSELVARSDLSVTTAQVMSKSITFASLGELTNPQATKYQDGFVFRYGILNVDRATGKVYSRQITNLTNGNYGSAQQALLVENNSNPTSTNEELVFVQGQLRTKTGNFLVSFIPFESTVPVRNLAIVDPEEFANSTQP